MIESRHPPFLVFLFLFFNEVHYNLVVQANGEVEFLSSFFQFLYPIVGLQTVVGQVYSYLASAADVGGQGLVLVQQAGGGAVVLVLDRGTASTLVADGPEPIQLF